MKNKFIRLASKLTTAAMVVSMFASIHPAGAALATNRYVLMDRHQLSVSGGQTVGFTIQEAITGDDTTTPTLRITWASGFGDAGDLTAADVVFNDDGSPMTEGADCSGANNIVPRFVGATDYIEIDFCTGGDVVSGSLMTLVIDNAPGIANPSSAGSYQVDLTCVDVCAVTGFMDIGIADSDQVTVSAAVSSTMSFDVETNDAAPCTIGDPNGANAIALGTLTSASVTTSTEHICINLDSNADNGVVVQVKDATGGGLVSTSPVYTIDSGTATLVAGTEGYGLCIVDAVETSGTFTEVAPYAAGNCTAHEVGELTATFADMINSGGNPVDGAGYTSIDAQLKAAVAVGTPASASYTDTLTFRATSTY